MIRPECMKIARLLITNAFNEGSLTTRISIELALIPADLNNGAAIRFSVASI